MIDKELLATDLPDLRQLISAAKLTFLNNKIADNTGKRSLFKIVVRDVALANVEQGTVRDSELCHEVIYSLMQSSVVIVGHVLLLRPGDGVVMLSNCHGP